MTELDVVVLAAGKGTRMKSALPKVLHRLAGRSMLDRVLDTATALGARQVIVVSGHGAAQVDAAVAGRADTSRSNRGGDTKSTHGLAATSAMAQPVLRCVLQEPQLGTGHAVQQAAPVLSSADDTVVLVLNGDVPLIDGTTLEPLVRTAAAGHLALLTVTLEEPHGYGRIVRSGSPGSSGDVQAIIEEKDANPDQRALHEIYTGVMAAPAGRLQGWLSRLSNQNAQGEYYLTDVVAMAVADGVPVVGVPTDDPVQVAGINSPAQLAALERAFQRRQADALMEAGVRLTDPARIDIRGALHCGRDVEIDVGCIFEGDVELADNVVIGAHCVIANARIAAGAQVQPFSHIDGGAQPVEIGEGARIGPFARLRPGARLGAEVHIGNFVEVKNSTLGKGAKANHLAYLGDASVGARVNFGAGSITANYDGVNKHRTVLGDGASIGSNCVLVAPVTVGENCTVAGGSTITRDTEAGTLAVARARQVVVTRWKRPVKKISSPVAADYESSAVNEQPGGMQESK
jgi:bifunctional UDP-N-acetylglucosamine pyrophosphorylase/glucosamine-1-phosphate N-acetyltransferase